MSLIYKNDLIKIEIENAEIPWLKIFTIENIKEFSQCNNETKQEIFKYLDIIEKEMLPTAERDEILEFIKNSPRGIVKGYGTRKE